MCSCVAGACGWRAGESTCLIQTASDALVSLELLEWCCFVLMLVLLLQVVFTTAHSREYVRFSVNGPAVAAAATVAAETR
eukprot:10387599-Alexandrium_andersonii.AAC.1